MWGFAMDNVAGLAMNTSVKCISRNLQFNASHHECYMNDFIHYSLN